ncbi:hypothetical protein L1987_47730 [Smallanthus sonchifolius]|uniref:Uncharacterized protein n=1 Tax=Smallanthus sonchifolius TaxID=185202 RepID=A0ACB9G571_9ASTR|nr:hypothetical protein L1987_47730 [Smallanthus sonchifolius]
MVGMLRGHAKVNFTDKPTPKHQKSTPNPNPACGFVEEKPQAVVKSFTPSAFCFSSDQSSNSFDFQYCAKTPEISSVLSEATFMEDANPAKTESGNLVSDYEKSDDDLLFEMPFLEGNWDAFLNGGDATQDGGNVMDLWRSSRDDECSFLIKSFLVYSSTLFLSLVASATLVSHNPNRVGIREAYKSNIAENQGTGSSPKFKFACQVPGLELRLRRHSFSLELRLQMTHVPLQITSSGRGLVQIMTLIQNQPLFQSTSTDSTDLLHIFVTITKIVRLVIMFISKISRLGAQTFKGLSKAPLTIGPKRSFSPIVQSDYLEPSSCKLFSTTATGNSQENNENPKVSVTFFDKDGEQEIKVPVGMSMLEAAHENDIELEGACEGSLACSTCHLIVLDVEQYNKLEDPTDEENDMLDLAFGLTETSRLGCQVIAKPELDGLRLALPAATRNFAVDGYKPKPH